MVASADGRQIIRAMKQGSHNEAITLATDCAQTLLHAGAAEIITRANEY